MCVCSSHVRLFCDPVDCSLSDPLSRRFPGQEYWSGLPFPFAGDLPAPGIKPESLASLALAAGFFTTLPPRKQDEKRLHGATSWWWQHFVGLPE